MTQPLDIKTVEDLLRRAQSKDSAALEELCRVVRVRLLGLVRFKVRGWSREDHEDLVQETMRIFVRDLHRIDHSPLTYAHAILQKRIWNELDRARRNREVSLDHHLPASATGDPSDDRDERLTDDSPDISERVEGKLELEQVWKAVQSMNHEFCKPLLTAIMEGYEIGELWARFHRLEPTLTRNTFYKRVFDCRKRLWMMLGGRDESAKSDV